MTIAHDSRKYVVKTLIFLGALLTLLSFGYMVQAEEARSENEVAFADTMAVSSESFDSVAGEQTLVNESEVEVIEAPVFEETGTASWYGDKFHGRRTANGERYDMYAYTAAHKTLPFGTILRVTNLDNNKSILVRVNDRGPFVRGRIIDLSRVAAKDIGVSLNRVKIEQFRPSGDRALGFRSDCLPLEIGGGMVASGYQTNDFNDAMKAWRDQTSKGQHTFLVVQPNTDAGASSYAIGTSNLPALAMR